MSGLVTTVVSESAKQTLVGGFAIGGAAVTCQLLSKTQTGGHIYTVTASNENGTLESLKYPMMLTAGSMVYFLTWPHFLSLMERSQTVSRWKKTKSWQYIGLSGLSRYAATVLGITLAAVSSRLKTPQQMMILGLFTTGCGVLVKLGPVASSERPPQTPKKPAEK